MPDAPELDARRRRLLFRARHRGTREADLMIGGFVARCIATLSDSELDELEAVLEYSDVNLADWLSGRRPVPADCDSPLLRRIAAEVAAARGMPGA
jgi:antitoxin CptB